MPSTKDPTIPSFIINVEQRIDLTIAPTNAQVADQGYTYDQAGFTYDQAGVQYGGVYQVNQDVAPIFFNDSATLLSPSISSIIDIGIQQGTITPNTNHSVGPGWFMYVTIP